MGKQRRSYSPEFKLEALRLLETSGKSGHRSSASSASATAVCANGKGSSRLVQPGLSGPRADLGRQEELVRLRRELEIVRQERDILKKAVAIFSRPNR